MKITDIIVEASCAHGQYYCSTDKKWKCRQGPKQTRKVSEGSYGHISSKYSNDNFSKPGRDAARASGARPSGPQRLFSECAEMLHISSNQLIALAKQFPGFPEVTQLGPNKRYCDLKAFKKWVIENNIREVIASKNWVSESDIEEAHPNSKIYDKCWDGYKKVPGKKRGEAGSCVKEELEETYDGDDFFEAYGELWYNEDEQLDEAEYHGRKVQLGKPMQGDVKKFKVYVKDPSTGNIKKVNFGDPDMKIRKSNPAARRSFRARHNCDNPGPRTKARYWSCRKW
jgi:hypothetical protein